MMNNHDYVNRLNYSSKAISFLELYAKYNSNIGNNESAKWIISITKILNDSVKFILPNKGQLIDANKYSQQHFDLFKIPFPVCAFEFPVVNGDSDLNTGLHISPSSKRIALCIESASDILSEHPSINRLKKQFNSGGVFIFSVYHTMNNWLIFPGGSFIPYNLPLKNTPSSSEHSKLIEKWTKKSSRKKTCNAYYTSLPFVFLPELAEDLFRATGYNETKLEAIIGADTADECQAVLQACSVINCKNIKIDDVPIPKALQLKRNKKGKAKLFDYKVLDIGEDFYKIQNSKEKLESGKKRMHLRRGHIRHYEDGSTTWVRHTTINANTQKKVNKVYRVNR